MTRNLTSETLERPAGLRTLHALEHQLYSTALADAAGDVKRAAHDLGISRGKLYRKLRLYELLAR